MFTSLKHFHPQKVCIPERFASLKFETSLKKKLHPWKKNRSHPWKKTFAYPKKSHLLQYIFDIFRFKFKSTIEDSNTVLNPSNCNVELYWWIMASQREVGISISQTSHRPNFSMKLTDSLSQIEIIQEGDKLRLSNVILIVPVWLNFISL